MKEYFEYLDDLRGSGVTNIYGAGVYLREAFDLDLREANDVLSKWMKTFDENKTMDERVKEATDEGDLYE
jgi:hypothetical protein